MKKNILVLLTFLLAVNVSYSQESIHSFLEKLNSGNYVIDFYCDVLKSGNRDTIHKYSDIYIDREFPDPDYGVVKYKWYDMFIFPMESIYIRIDEYNNEIDDEYFEISSHGIYPQNFNIKQNIEIYFEEDENNYLSDDESTFAWELVRKNKVNIFYFKFDGDYLYIYLNGQKDKDLFARFVKMDDETFNQFTNLISNNKCDLSKITWPRHADGSCDYDGSKKTPVVQTSNASSSTITPNQTMTVTENLKLRSGEATSTKVLSVMAAGTKVKILGIGKAEKIDGINSNWVKVEVQSGTKEKAGNSIKKGTVGWCYGGYLK